MSAPKAISTIERELARVNAAKREARRLGDTETQDWLYGAEVALAWSLGRDVMAPAAAFRIRASSENVAFTTQGEGGETR